MRTVKDMLEEANASVKRISVEAGRKMIEEKDALLLDVRDAPELEQSGKMPGAHHVPRGMLEFRADPDNQYYDPAFQRERPIILYCGSGGRSALAGKVLQEMGYREVYNLGGFRDYAAAGGEVEGPG